ncbi:hypothetical protein GHT06_022819 [Daphnia sinensis]|uniref:Uncharacterized protein n=1 Tax=Daphnia sinensis TaxID=1820382 RepID=A0AAD5L7F8_9CRUS|nr:hypothetical protein GHT06_022819 [Daphnia sinensis]
MNFGRGRSQLLFLVFVVIGLILMVVSGLVVYYVFCVPPQPSTGNAVIDNKVDVSAVCPPPVPPTNCPAPPDDLPLCNFAPTCPPIPAVPCTNVAPQACRPCPTHPPCTAWNCQPVVCPTAAPIHVPNIIGNLSTYDMTNTKAIDLIRRYPPNSYERLQVAVQLMDFSIEWWVNLLTIRNCHFDKRKVCTFCKDRYRYLRCIVENELESNRYTDRESGNANRIYMFHDRDGRDWFPSNFRHRADHSTKNEAYTAKQDPNYDATYGMETDTYEHFFKTQKALSFWIDRPGTPNRRHCTPCDGSVAMEHVKCTTYAHFDWALDWWPPHQ